MIELKSACVFGAEPIGSLSAGAGSKLSISAVATSTYPDSPSARYNRVVSPCTSCRSCRILNPFRRFAISAAGNCDAANITNSPSCRTLRIPNCRIRLKNPLNGCRHSMLVMMQRNRPAALLQLITGIAHDHRMPGKRQHLHIIVVVADCHDLAAVKSPVASPPLQRMPLRTSGIQNIHDTQVSVIILRTQDRELSTKV